MDQPNNEPVADAMNSLFPPGFLKVVGFLIPADETTRELIDWYEEIHSTNASFLWPHMNVYRRNFIMDVELGPVPTYRVVTEFIWKSEDAKKAAAALFATPAAEATVNEKYPAWMKPLDIPNTNGLAAAESIEIATPVQHVDEPLEVRRRILLLDQNAKASQTDVDAAARRYAEKIAGSLNVAVSLDLCRQQTSWPTTRAVIYVNDSNRRDLPAVDGDILKVANIFSVETRRSPI